MIFENPSSARIFLKDMSGDDALSSEIDDSQALKQANWVVQRVALDVKESRALEKYYTRGIVMDAAQDVDLSSLLKDLRQVYRDLTNPSNSTE